MALNERVLEAGSHLPRRLPRKLTTRGGSIRNSLISPGREYARTHAAAERSPAVSARLLMRGSPRLEIELHVDGISFRQRAALYKPLHRLRSTPDLTIFPPSNSDILVFVPAKSYANF